MMNEYFSSITYMMPQLKVGDKEAWNNLCHKFSVGLTHKARRFISDSKMGATLNADDLVQESLLKAWKRIHKFRGITTAQFAAWLIKIVRNTFLDWCKSPNNKTSLLGSLSWFEFHDGTASPSKIVINSELESKLYASLAELDHRSQRVIILRHFEGMKFVEIAIQMGLNPNTAASVYRRGIEILKKQLEQ